MNIHELWGFHVRKENLQLSDWCPFSKLLGTWDTSVSLCMKSQNCEQCF